MARNVPQICIGSIPYLCVMEGGLGGEWGGSWREVASIESDFWMFQAKLVPTFKQLILWQLLGPKKAASRADRYSKFVLSGGEFRILVILGVL
jgi:hypothetical protein